MEVIYEDNHLIIINKSPGEIVQGDKTGDEPLVETLKHWLKEKYGKPATFFVALFIALTARSEDWLSLQRHRKH